MQQLKGRFMKQAYSKGQYMVAFYTDQEVKDEYLDMDLTIDIKQFRKDRSLDANAYYWVLVGKLADVLGQAQAWVHNEMIRKYGQMEIIDGSSVRIMLLDTEETEKEVDQNLKIHLRPTSQVKRLGDGKDYRTYVLMRGSSTYNSKEFSTLLEGLCEECKSLGISTMTPNEMEQLKGYERTMPIHR